MKLLTVKDKVVSEQSFPGLITTKIEHKVISATGAAVYSGPMIDPVVWAQVIAFFEWTYDTTKSESQVRLYVNPLTKTWAAWAFPQEARSGMSAKEIDCPEAKVQREAFKDGDGWIYFGTVHHHCSAGAFQSGTDEANERSQDGLHITVGDIDKKQHDLHIRFYLNQNKWEPDMGQFWDVGEQVRSLLPPDLWDRVARHQMGRMAPEGCAFPEQWKANLIEVKQTFPPPVCQTGPWRPGQGTSYQPNYPGDVGYKGPTGPTYFQQKSPWEREKEALSEYLEEALEVGILEEEAMAFLKELTEERLWDALSVACTHSQVDVDEVITDAERLLRDLDQDEAKKALKEDNGDPKWDGMMD